MEAIRRRTTARGPRALLALVAPLLLGGCASIGWDGVIDVRIPQGEADGDAAPFRIASVEDRRKFARVSYALRTPSLYRPDEVADEDIPRIVGRRDGTRGGNLWLPEERSVTDLAAEAASRALVGAGLREVAAESEEAPGAIPVSIEVLALWAWLRPTYFAPDVTHAEVAIRIQAPVPPLGGGALVCGKSQKVAPAISSALWAATLQAALADLERDLAQALATPGRPAPAWRCRPGLAPTTARVDE